MINFQQQTGGDSSPIINGNENHVNQKINKAGWTLLGFILGVATSFIGSFLYDKYVSWEKVMNNQTEIPINYHSTSTDSIQ